MIGDGLQRLGCSTALRAFGEGIEPRGILRLRREQSGGSVPPSLRTGPPIRRRAIAGGGQGLPGLLSRAATSLPLGIGERMFAIGFATLGHGRFTVT